MNPFGDLRVRPPLPEGPFLVVGLARSGAAAARVLVARGERVLGCDSGHPNEAEGLADAGVEVNLDVDGTALLEEARTVVKSPGVPQTAPVIEAARERDIEVIGELELSWRLIPNVFFAVTGTNGKTTATELLGHIHREAGMPVAVAGNVGTPLAELAGEIEPDATVVCEASSFQLEDSSAFAPECALMLNLAPDHLDRHGNVENYLDAKLNVFANQGNDDVAVYNAATSELSDRDLGGCARRVRFCPQEQPEGAADPDCELSMRDGVIFALDDPLIDASELKLIGPHNIENAMGAAAAALAGGIDREAVADGLRSFEAVPHRLEPVRELGGVLYVNDSKATNVAAAIAAIRSFDGGVHAILGGSTKGESFDLLAGSVLERCSAVYLIGQAADEIAAALAPAALEGMELVECETLDRAVQVAAAQSSPGHVVLLSPACASFDSFRDYEERGERFRELVEALS